MGVGVNLVSLGALLALHPSEDFLGKGIDDPSLYVLEDRVRVLVPVDGDGLLVERLQLGQIPIEQVHFELDSLFCVFWVLQESGLDFHGRRGLVHEVVPVTEKGKQVTHSPAQRAGEKGSCVYC